MTMFDTALCTPKSEIDHRIARLQSELAKSDTQAALILQNVDLFYFTGTLQQGYLYVPVEGEPLLMVRKDRRRAAAESPVASQVPIRSPKQLHDRLAENGHRRPSRLGLELDVLPAAHYRAFQQIFEATELVDATPAIRRIRAVKSDYEIAAIREAARRADQVSGCVPEILREGITEIELAGRIEAEARKRGHQGIVRMRMWGGELFYGHLMAGAAAAVPSFLASPTGGAALSPAIGQGPSMRPIRAGEPVLVDYVFAYNGYIADHTRIFAVGTISDDLQAAHQAVLELQSDLAPIGRPGTAAGRLYDAAVAWMADRGYADVFMGWGEERIRFVGHGVGLELDELPVIGRNQDMPLQENMVIALEPKLVFPGRGVVGIENTHRVTPSGFEQLTRCEERIVVV